MKEKKLELKKTIEMNEQNTYEKKNRKNTIPEALNPDREKEKKEESIQKMERFGTRPKNRTIQEKPFKFYNAPNWNPSHTCPALDKVCNNCGKKGHFARAENRNPKSETSIPRSKKNEVKFRGQIPVDIE